MQSNRRISCQEAIHFGSHVFYKYTSNMHDSIGMRERESLKYQIHYGMLLTTL